MVPLLADKIKQVRKQNGLNQTDFASRLGVDKSMICNYENGSRQPSLRMLIKIASTFHVSTDYLLNLSENKSSSLIIDIKGYSETQIQSLKTIITAVTETFNVNNKNEI